MLRLGASSRKNTQARASSSLLQSSVEDMQLRCQLPGEGERDPGDDFGDDVVAVILDIPNKKQQKQQNAPNIDTLMRTSGKSVLSVCIV